MILADTSIWIDHLRGGDAVMTEQLERGSIAMHPFVLGEIALGSLKSRAELLQLLEALPRTLVASDAEVMHMVDERALFGRGLGWVDVHLLAATLLTPGLRLWTRDRRLHAVAEEIGLASSPGVH